MDRLPWPSAESLDAQKYRLPGESFKEKCNRIAAALAPEPDRFYKLREILLDQRFLPGGRIQTAVGTSRAVTAFNCFVSGPIEDSFVDGDGCIMDRVKEAATTMRMGGGIGYDFSTIRPSGDRIRKLDSIASGPVSFMEIFDATCRTIASAGHRRGAQMGVLRCDHPDIEAFVKAKRREGHLTAFNISVACTDDFMRAVDADADFTLHFMGRDYQTVRARSLWDQIMRSTWDWGDPGVVFIDRMNAENNLHYCETIAATNPCSEQPLPPYGACLLGSFNLTRYVHDGRFDYGRLAEDACRVVPAMDRVIDLSRYPLERQELEALRKRRMGLGVTGLANAAAMCGIKRYGSDEFCAFAVKVLDTLRIAAYGASAAVAAKLGAFPLYNRDQYLAGAYTSRLPDTIRDLIGAFGIRNSHLISIAPTGTISMTAGNVSSGIEPTFSKSYTRTIQTVDGPMEETISDYAWREFGVENGEACDLAVSDHLSVLEAMTPFVDSAISKTINVSGDLPWEDFKDIYMKAWRGGVKAVATFTTGGLKDGLLKECRSGVCEL